MSSTTSSFASAWTPADYGDLLVATASQESIAIQTTKLVTTDRSEYRVPLVTAEISSGWYGELDPLALGDIATGEEIVRPAKLAALSKISRELADDSTPDAAREVGNSIGRSIASSMDEAFFGTGDGTGDVPKGLGAFLDTQVQAIDAGAAWTNGDPFTDAVFAVSAEGGNVTAFVANPADAKALAKLKRETDSNEPLLAATAHDSTRMAISGVPLYVSRHVPEGTVYGYDSSRLHTVLRTQSELDFDTSRYFDEHAVAVRGVTRVAWGYTHPATIARITITPVG